MSLETEKPLTSATPKLESYETLDAVELAKRWCLPETWIREQVRTRAVDPVPHLRFGKYVRFQWGHPELVAWFERHRYKPR